MTVRELLSTVTLVLVVLQMAPLSLVIQWTSARRILVRAKSAFMTTARPAMEPARASHVILDKTVNLQHAPAMQNVLELVLGAFARHVPIRELVRQSRFIYEVRPRNAGSTEQWR